MVSLFWYMMMMMMMFVCEKEMCLFYAGVECESSIIEREVRSRATKRRDNLRGVKVTDFLEYVLGIPWDIDTDGLKDYMTKFGELEDCIVMKERSSGRSRGFGYVTFASVDDAKEEMRAPSKKVTRIFVARIPPSVTEAAFRRVALLSLLLFILIMLVFSRMVDIYYRVVSTNVLRLTAWWVFSCGIEARQLESVDNLMAESHELGGSTIVVDRATPKAIYNITGLFTLYFSFEDDFRPVSRMTQGGYGAYNAYISAATRYAALGAPTLYDHPGSIYGRGESTRGGMGKKIFVGRLPQEATTDDLRQYFGRFGRILDVYIPKDPKRTGHRGFGFVTFAEDGVADRVSRRSHEICGQQVAIDSATPVDDAGPSGNIMMDNAELYGGYGGPMRTYGRMYGTMDFDNWSYGMGGGRPSRGDLRYRPY
ncbi:hypothetical protein TEA_005569 [Camellia sinensis var. sinensis]|uniref:RRM domain-containing protein n=1 Tax=Camellia sinensis var. sinensis TaxID=542762 RepID=A0A4S4EUM5_CAMSN|nr:hypothetical protein TEA_005569 [Camellia sinensis var. sinensis]